MTLQEMFDAMVLHIRTQRIASTGVFDGVTKCAYRGDAGRKCPVGAIIPDKVYSRRMEGEACSHSVVVCALSRAGVLSEDVDLSDKQLRLMGRMQGVHDTFMPRVGHDIQGCWPAVDHRLAQIASVFSVTYTPEPSNV